MKRWTRIFAPMVAFGLVITASVAALGNAGANAQSTGYAPVAVVAQAQPQAPSPTAEPDEGYETPDAQEGPETPDAQEAPEGSDAAEAAEAAALASKAVISEQQAIDVALAANPGTTLVKASLDNENGVVVYSVELSNGADVKVDATTGQIASTDQAGEQDEMNEVDHHDGAQDEVSGAHSEQPATPAQP